MKFSGLKDVLRTFDEHGWKGSFTRGLWTIGNGGYDCWFELSYKGLPVVRCIDGVLESNFSYIESDDKENLITRILEAYPHLGRPFDFSEVPTEKLEEMSREAWSNYYKLATKPCGDWHPGMQFPELDKATRYLNAVNDEMERRTAEKGEGSPAPTNTKERLNDQICRAEMRSNSVRVEDQSSQKNDLGR